MTEFFVLYPLKNDHIGEASRIAIRAYAAYLKRMNAGDLTANELLTWLEKIDANLKFGKKKGVINE